MKSVIILLNYNDSEHTKALAAVLNKYDCFTRVIVVDNCSTDDSFSILKASAGDKTDVIQAPSNGGYAKGNNYGAHYALKTYQPDILFIANPDTQITEAAAKNIIQAMQTNPSYGVLTAMVNQGCNVWNLPGFLGIIESLFLVWFTLDKKRIRNKLLKSTNNIETVGVVEGSLFAVCAEAFQKINGLDERTFLYAEEIMLSKRMKECGYKVGILPHERYDHFHSVSIKKQYKSSKAKAFHHFYDSFLLYNKEYLHTNKLQDILFELCYRLAYFERVIYDILKR